MNAIETAREAILSQLAPLYAEQEEIKSRDAEIQRLIEPLEAALKPLNSQGKSKSKARKKAGKDTAKKVDVLPVAITIVEANPGIEQSDLKDLVEHKLANEGGFSLTGVAAQLNKYLNAAPFVLSPDGCVSLVRDESSDGLAGRPDQAIHAE